jgi:hypothetical protein
MEEVMIDQTATTEPMIETVVDGPSKFELLCLGLGEGQIVTFYVRKGVAGSVADRTSSVMSIPVKVAIDGIDREDGSNESWTVRGSIPGTDTIVQDDGGRRVAPGVEVPYSTITGTGTLKRGVIR